MNIFGLVYIRIYLVWFGIRGVFRGAKIYGFQGVFRLQRVLSPPGKKEKFKPFLDKFPNTPLKSFNFNFDQNQKSYSLTQTFGVSERIYKMSFSKPTDNKMLQIYS